MFNTKKIQEKRKNRNEKKKDLRCADRVRKIVPALLLLLNRRAPGEGTPCPRPREERKECIPSFFFKKRKRALLDGYTARSPPIVPPHETVIKTLPPTVVSSAVAIRFGLFLFLSRESQPFSLSFSLSSNI